MTKFYEIAENVIEENDFKGFNESSKYRFLGIKALFNKLGLYEDLCEYVQKNVYKDFVENKVRYESIMSKEVKKKGIFS